MPTLTNVSFDDYLRDKGYGSSDLRNFAKLPALVPWHRANRSDATDATSIGSAAHCLILTPNLFEATYCVKPPGMTFSTKEGKAWREEKRAAGYLDDNILSDAEFNQVSLIAGAFLGKQAASKSRANAIGIEQSAFWVQDDLPCKCRPDWFTRTHIYDLKISVHAKDIGTLRFRAWNEGWMHQLAHGRNGLRACGHNVTGGRLVVIAPKGPSAIQTYCLEVSEHTLDVIELELESIRKGMAVCHRTGVWPGTSDEWETIEIPSSAFAADIEQDNDDAVEVE